MKKPPRRILVICIRRLGDVLLSTALIRSLKREWPQAQIDVLVNEKSAVTLQGNPDIAQLIVQPEKPKFADLVKIVWRIFRRYALAVSTLYNDRPQIYALLAAGTRASVVPHRGEPGAWWKRRAASFPAALKLGKVHAVEQYLVLADALSVPRDPRVVPPRPPNEDGLDARLGAGWKDRPYAVIHPSPLYRYKAWTVEGWSALAMHLTGLGLQVYITGTGDPAEKELAEAIAASRPQQIASLAGQLRFPELTPLIEGARIFIGPDTSVTHLAAATGRPTIALFGPSHPIAWGPWPQGYRGEAPSPWVMNAPLQHQGNVWIVQGIQPCVPCLKEGCEGHINSRADCLTGLPATRVIAVVGSILSTPLI